MNVIKLIKLLNPVASSVIVAAVLSACTSMAPNYERPSGAVSAAWPTGAAYVAEGSTASTAQIPWQSFVLDARLRQVIEQALADSRDLRQAAASVESARAQYRVQRAEALPSVDAGMSATRSRSLGSGAGFSGTLDSKQYTANVGVSAWELDLFGRLRSLSDAALESYFASEEAMRATRVSLIAETASAWLALAADRNQLRLAQQTAESAQRSMALTRKRLEAGVASRVDLHQAETVYQQARSDIASTTTAIAQDRNALELLVGGAIDDALLPDQLPAIESVFAPVAAGLSSTVLLDRPDVLQAEHNLKSANADIGAARAAFFPTLSLTASTGVASSALSSLFDSHTGVWSLAPSLSLPIFSGGANRANLADSKAQKASYVAAYELAVQTAFKEVADSLARSGTMSEQLDAQSALVEAAGKSEMLARARYTKGVDTFLNALDSQRTLYSAQQTLISTQLTALDNRLSLYRAIGGGAG